MSAVTQRGAAELGRRYARALRRYLEEGGESGLARAYGLGREAIEEGLGVLDLASLYHAALDPLLHAARTPEEGARATESAHEFLLESLSPFEMVHRGFREANARLRDTNETLRRERATLAGVMASMSDGVVFVDSDRLVRYCNVRAGELLTLEPSALVGQSAETLYARMGRTATDMEPALAEAQGRAAFGFEVASPGPPPRDLLVHVFPVGDADSADSGVGMVLRDVTAERELARAKDEIVSIVSHELRTPLSSILGFAELLRARRLDEASRKRYLALIVAESRRLGDLINRFLNVQRIQAGDELELELFDLHELLSTRVELYSGESERHTLAFERPGGPMPVVADRDRIAEVVGNLLSNAIKYSPAGGAITLTAQVRDELVRVSVADPGLGIPTDQQDRIFTKFFRVRSSATREIGGTGLGLALCRQIVEAHSGRIGFESSEGSGSTFWFELPAGGASRA